MEEKHHVLLPAVGVVCYSWTNNPGWDLKVELRSCCGSECHTRDPPTHSAIFVLWSPAQSCCCRQTKVLLDLCRENLVMRLKWQGRQEEGWKWTREQRQEQNEERWRCLFFQDDLLPCWSGWGFLSTFSSSFQYSSFTLYLFIIVIPFCPLWKVETSQAKTK